MNYEQIDAGHQKIEQCPHCDSWDTHNESYSPIDQGTMLEYRLCNACGDDYYNEFKFQKQIQIND